MADLLYLTLRSLKQLMLFENCYLRMNCFLKTSISWLLRCIFINLIFFTKCFDACFNNNFMSCISQVQHVHRYEKAFTVKFQSLYNHSIGYVWVWSPIANIMLYICSLRLKFRSTILISNKSLCTKFLNNMVTEILIIVSILKYFVTPF